MESYIIRNGKVILENKIVGDTDILIKNGKIAALVPRGCGRYDAMEINAEGKYVSSGFVDIHQHGGGGSDYMDGDEEAYLKAFSAHVLHGTTSIMPTTLSADKVETERAIRAFLKVKNRNDLPCNVLGINMEGPYLSPYQSGAQSAGCIRNFVEAEYKSLYELSEGSIKRWSVAPELKNVEKFAEFAVSNGITLSIAHSNATFEEVERAFELGFRHITHFYSCVSTVTRKGGFRIAGIVEAAYYLDDMNVELIADGCHLPSSLLKLVAKLKPTKNIALVTDAMRAAGENVTESFLGSKSSPQPVVIEDGVAKLPSREAFAGSIATADRLLRTMISAGIPLIDAVKMITVNPLRMMNIRAKKGNIQEGFDADICIFDDDINVNCVFVNGKRAL